jgi:sulfur-carrier protein
LDRTPHPISGSLPLPPALFKSGRSVHPSRAAPALESSVARITFTSHLRAVGPCTPTSYDGTTLAEVLDGVAADYPLLKGYVLDDQGRLRKHITIFIDCTMQPRDSALDIPLTRASTVYVLQALSGG